MWHVSGPLECLKPSAAALGIVAKVSFSALTFLVSLHAGHNFLVD